MNLFIHLFHITHYKKKVKNLTKYMTDAKSYKTIYVRLQKYLKHTQYTK